MLGFLFCEQRKAFGYEIVLRGIFFTAKHQIACFEIQPRQRSFRGLSAVHFFNSVVKKITFLKGNLRMY